MKILIFLKPWFLPVCFFTLCNRWPLMTTASKWRNKPTSFCCHLTLRRKSLFFAFSSFFLSSFCPFCSFFLSFSFCFHVCRVKSSENSYWSKHGKLDTEWHVVNPVIYAFCVWNAKYYTFSPLLYLSFSCTLRCSCRGFWTTFSLVVL